MDERSKITALAFSPHNPDVILAGTQFAAMFRSEDHGRSWRQLDLDIVEICSNKNQSRFTQIVFDQVDPRLAWAESSSTARGGAPTAASAGTRCPRGWTRKTFTVSR